MPKRVIFDVGHPAQVHQFKHLYWILSHKGWDCLFVAKDKDITKTLLEKYDLKHKILSKNKKGLLKKILNIPLDDYKFYKIVKMFKPDFILNRFSIHSAHISKLLKIANIAFSDTEHTSFFHKLTIPFIDVKFTGESYYADLGKNHLKYRGNIELFYLHPSIFKPDITILEELGINSSEKYVLIRFVSWDAHHDIGEKGFSLDYKFKLVEELSKYAKVYITSEAPLPEELSKYQIRVSPEKMHSVMNYADLYIGEGGTMASEAACLGVPSIYVNSLDAGVFNEEESFGLLHSFRGTEGVTKEAIAILSDDNAKEKYKERLVKFLEKQINATHLIVWFLENYPDSLQVLKNNKEYQSKFK